MATGAVTFGKTYRAVELFSGLTAANSPPTAATDGVPCAVDPFKASGAQAAEGANYLNLPAAQSTIAAKCVGSGGTVTMTLRLWGYVAVLGEWVPIGNGADATKGTLNDGAAIGEVKTDKALHVEPFLYAGNFDRIYLELAAVGGTTPSASAWLITPSRVAY